MFRRRRGLGNLMTEQLFLKLKLIQTLPEPELYKIKANFKAKYFSVLRSRSEKKSEVNGSKFYDGN